MTAVYLRLAGPLQSWAGDRLTGNVVTTDPLPARRPIVGLVAACLGAARDQFPEWLDEIDIQVRVDNAGQVISEFQTINPRDEDLPFQKRIHLALTGKTWTHQAHFTPDAQRGLDNGRLKGTSIVRRTYISGGEFLVSLTHETRAAQLYQALRKPIYSPYLGKKAFAPTAPFLLGFGAKGLLETSIPVFAQKTEHTYYPYFDQVDEDRNSLAKELRLFSYLHDGEKSWKIARVPRISCRKEWTEAIRDLLPLDSISNENNPKNE